MAKKRTHHKSKQVQIPVAIVGGFMPAAVDLWDHKSSFKDLGMEAGRIFLGWDYMTARFDYNLMKWGTFPIVLGILVHKIVGQKLGVNRLLANSGVPWVRV